MPATEFAVTGRVLKVARLRDEYYVAADDPAAMVTRLKAQCPGADLFTFVQTLDDVAPRFDHALSWDDMAVLPVSTYSHWFDKQIKFKPRNRLRKAWKSGVETRTLAFDDELVRGITEIYNETPLRQGKANWHYRKDVETVRREHATLLARSEFAGAFYEGELIGFCKLTHGEHASIIMNIVAKVSHRDKAPMNALVAKAIELVAARGVPLLNYGVWGRRGLNEFKVANAFEKLCVPRYHLPLTTWGALALRLGLHRSLKECLPERWIVALADTRGRLNEWRYAGALAKVRPAEPGASATSANPSPHP